MEYSTTLFISNSKINQYMRKFVIIQFLFWTSFFCVIGLIRFVWIKTFPLHVAKIPIEDSINSIVLGPSNGEFAWNDSIIPHSRNLCGTANSLGACNNTLKMINVENVDTVLLCASIVAILYQSDKQMINALENLQEERKNVLNYPTFFDFFKDKVEYWKYALTTFPSTNLYNDVGIDGYQLSDRNRLNHPSLFNRVNNLKNEAGGKYGFTEKYIRDHCKFQIGSLLNIKKFCDENHKTLVILSTPIYKWNDIIDDSGYRQLIRAELGDSTLIADYSKFNFPDSTYYGDLEHLNSKGAKYWSEHIARNGLKLQFAVDYCK